MGMCAFANTTYSLQCMLLNCRVKHIRTHLPATALRHDTRDTVYSRVVCRRYDNDQRRKHQLSLTLTAVALMVLDVRGRRLKNESERRTATSDNSRSSRPIDSITTDRYYMAILRLLTFCASAPERFICIMPACLRRSAATQLQPLVVADAKQAALAAALRSSALDGA